MLRPVYDAHGRRGRPRLDRGRPAPRATTPDAHDRLGRSRCGRPSTGPNVFIKIPATRRGAAGDHRGARRGHQRQRHADLLARALRRGARRVRDGPGAGAGQRARPRAHRVGRVVLRLARRHRDRPAARRDRHARGGRRCAARRRSPTPASPTALFQEVVAGDRWTGARRRRRPPAAAAVGVDGRQGPGLPRHALRRRARRRRRRSTRCPRSHARGRRRPRRRRAATRSRARRTSPRPCIDRPARRSASTSTTSPSSSRSRAWRSSTASWGELLATVDEGLAGAAEQIEPRPPGEPAQGRRGPQPAARPARPPPARASPARAAS